jgi:hypothetical protein
MQIIRIPKSPTGAAVARLVMTSGSNGRVNAIFKVDGPMSGSTEQSEHESIEQAESAAVAYAKQRGAICLVIENCT